MNILYLLNVGLLSISSLFLSFILLNLIFEKEKRGSIIIVFTIIVNSSIWLLFIKFNSLRLINISFTILLSIFIIISLIKYFPKEEERNLENISKYDERDTMFARDNLKNHPKLYDIYYSKNPELKKTDDPIHEKGNLEIPPKLYYDKYLSPVFDASFTFLDEERRSVKINKNKEKLKTDKNEITKTIKYIAKLYGAVDIGITKLKPYHFYSFKGRQAEDWGRKIENNHTWGIAIIVPMEVEMLKKAPTVHTILESSKAYVEAAKIANIIMTYIKKLGYDAKAHTDGNYETLCVPIAIDSGLGELSRMGLMIHKDYGPSIRISIVTTDVELIPTKGENLHISSFCKICKKCADNCPSGAISRDNEPESRGFKHWSINQEKCFAFWKSIGTDCGFCIRTCPYTKPNTLFHKLIRYYISRNPINQRIALFSDDLLFGRKFKLPKTNFPI